MGAGVKLALDLDGVLGDTRALWDAWLVDVGDRLGLGDLPQDRAEAAAILDREAGNWRTLLERFAADRAPVYLRPSSEVAGTLRRLRSAEARLAVFTDAPEELARLALAHLGADRRVDSLHAGEDAEARALADLGEGARPIRTRSELLDLT